MLLTELGALGQWGERLPCQGCDPPAPAEAPEEDGRCGALALPQVAWTGEPSAMGRLGSLQPGEPWAMRRPGRRVLGLARSGLAAKRRGDGKREAFTRLKASIRVPSARGGSESCGPDPARKGGTRACCSATGCRASHAAGLIFAYFCVISLVDAVF